MPYVEQEVDKNHNPHRSTVHESSLYAVHMACNSLLMGDCDAALACGSTVITNPVSIARLVG